MPQLVVNTKVNTQNKHRCKLENNNFIMRHAAHSNRYISAGSLEFSRYLGVFYKGLCVYLAEKTSFDSGYLRAKKCCSSVLGKRKKSGFRN